MDRVLFITLSNIGDAVLTTPALEWLHQRYPESTIDILAHARSQVLFTHCPYRGDILLRERKDGWRGMLSLIGSLRQRHYRAVADLRTDGLAYLLRADQRFTKWGGRKTDGHAVEEHMSIVAPRDAAIPPTRLWLNDALREQARTRLAALPGDRCLALGPGANWEPKIWPTHRYRELAQLMRDHFDKVLLLGGPKDRERAALVAEGLDLPCLNMAGETGLLEAAALLEQCTAFVGNDSGLGHIASAVDTPTLVVFGPGRPQRYHPWGPHCRWIRDNEHSIEELNARRVADALHELLVAVQ